MVGGADGELGGERGVTTLRTAECREVAGLASEMYLVLDGLRSQDRVPLLLIHVSRDYG